MNSNMSFQTSQRTCELRNEVRNICGQSFVKSTVKSSPGWGISHSQLAQGLCISLQVVSRHPGIYTIITGQIKCPGVFPGGMVTPGIDSCISAMLAVSVARVIWRDSLAKIKDTKIIGIDTQSDIWYNLSSVLSLCKLHNSPQHFRNYCQSK